MAAKKIQLNWNLLLKRIQHPVPEKLVSFVDGAGDPVILLHGLGAHSYSWRYLTPALNKVHQTIQYDLLGFGASPKPSNTNYSIYDHAALVIRAIEDRGLSNVSLVGHSFGGGVCLIAAAYFAATKPELIKKLVLIGSIGCRQSIPWFIRLLRIPFIPEKLGYIVPPRVSTKTMLDIAFYDRRKITQELIDAYSKPSSDPAARRAVIETAKQIQPDDLDELIERYNKVSAPTLLVWGQQDKIVPLKIGKQLHSLLSNSQLHVEPSCGHLPHEEKPEVAVPLIHDFLNRP